MSIFAVFCRLKLISTSHLISSERDCIDCTAGAMWNVLCQSRKVKLTKFIRIISRQWRRISISSFVAAAPVMFLSCLDELNLRAYFSFILMTLMERCCVLSIYIQLLLFTNGGQSKYFEWKNQFVFSCFNLRLFYVKFTQYLVPRVVCRHSMIRANSSKM